MVMFHSVVKLPQSKTRKKIRHAPKFANAGRDPSWSSVFELVQPSQVYVDITMRAAKDAWTCQIQMGLPGD